jgi:D-alanine-D-alanine ligase
MNRRMRVGVIFGGRSVEHLDPGRYEVIPIGITRQGKWVTAPDASRLMKEGMDSARTETCFIPGDPTAGGLVRLGEGRERGAAMKLDVVFPVVHGGHGEDGTLQGLLELAEIPYVGAGVMASAVGMDKDMMKRVFREAGLPVVKSRTLLRGEWEGGKEAWTRELSGELGYPCFAKPANTGSSVGITKAHDSRELERGLDLAFRYDRKAVVEAGVDAREVECSVLGNDQPIASAVGEIVPCNEFYDYEAKYLADGSRLIIPAELPPGVEAEVRRIALAAFKAVDGAGMARVDFLLDRRAGSLFLNELNTLPGFTPISMYPKLWGASGLSYPQLLDRLIELALERHRDRKRCDTDFKPPKETRKS